MSGAGAVAGGRASGEAASSVCLGGSEQNWLARAGVGCCRAQVRQSVRVRCAVQGGQAMLQNGYTIASTGRL